MIGDLNGGLPVWAKVLSIVGIPGAGLFFLLHFLTVGVAADIRLNREAMDLHAVASARHEAQSEARVARLEAVLSQICRNTATNPSDRRECDLIALKLTGVR